MRAEWEMSHLFHYASYSGVEGTIMNFNESQKSLIISLNIKLDEHTNTTDRFSFLTGGAKIMTTKKVNFGVESVLYPDCPFFWIPKVTLWFLVLFLLRRSTALIVLLRTPCINEQLRSGNAFPHILRSACFLDA